MNILYIYITFRLWISSCHVLLTGVMFFGFSWVHFEVTQCTLVWQEKIYWHIMSRNHLWGEWVKVSGTSKSEKYGSGQFNYNSTSYGMRCRISLLLFVILYTYMCWMTFAFQWDWNCMVNILFATAVCRGEVSYSRQDMLDDVRKWREVKSSTKN